MALLELFLEFDLLEESDAVVLVADAVLAALEALSLHSVVSELEVFASVEDGADRLDLAAQFVQLLELLLDADLHLVLVRVQVVKVLANRVIGQILDHVRDFSGQSVLQALVLNIENTNYLVLVSGELEQISLALALVVELLCVEVLNVFDHVGGGLQVRVHECTHTLHGLLTEQQVLLGLVALHPDKTVADQNYFGAF